MRRIEADIDGTETEKRLFARFRAVTADGVAAHLCNFTAFWRRLSPATGWQDGAVKHAVVALAAAYQLFQYPNEPVIDGFTRSDLDLFTIRQYNRSIERLQSHAGSSAAESIRVTLVCCLAFISLETLRGNHDVAVAHLTNGLRILQSLPDSSFDCLADGSIFVWPPSSRDSLHMPDIIQIFTRLEVTACLFTHGIQPVVSERGYRTRHFDDGSSNPPFPDAPHARLAMSCFLHDAIARLHELAAVTAAGPDAAALFWSDPAQQRQQSSLLARSARLGALAADFFSPARFGAPDPSTPDLYTLSLDLLHFRCARFLLAHSTTPNPFFPHDPTPETADSLPQILQLATRLAHSPLSRPPQPPSSPRPPTDNLLGPLFLTAAYASEQDEESHGAALRLLADLLVSRRQGGEGTSPRGQQQQQQQADQGMVMLVERAVGRGRRRQHSPSQQQKHQGRGSSDSGVVAVSTEVPRALTGVGCVPLLWDGVVGGGS